MQNAGHQHGSWFNHGQANPDLPNNTPPQQEDWVHTCREDNPGEVSQGQSRPGQVIQGRVNSIRVTSCQDNPDEVNACQGYNLDHATMGWQVNQGHFSLGQVNSARVKQDHNLIPNQNNLGRINHAIFTFDLCRLLLKMLSTKSSQAEGECQYGVKEAGRQTCKRRSETQTGQQWGRLTGKSCSNLMNPA